MRKLFALFMLLCLALCADNTVTAKPKKLTETITWELKEDGTLVIAGTGEMPDFSNRKYAPWVKKATLIKAVVIGEGITYVGDHSFDNFYMFILSNETGYWLIRDVPKKKYQIKQVSLSQTLTRIGDYAFRGNYITTLEIPNNVHSIGHNAFAMCSIKNLKLSSGLRFINSETFRSNNIRTLVIPEGVTSIGEAAFYNHDINNLKLPSTLEDIGDYAFSDTWDLEPTISSLILPNNLKEIGKKAFFGSLKRDADLSVNSKIKSIGYKAFEDEKGLFTGTIHNMPSFITPKNCENIGISKNAYNRYNPYSDDLYEKGYDFYYKDNYDKALEYFVKGATTGKGTKVGDCYLYAGKCYEKLKDYDNAITMYDKAKSLGKKCDSDIDRCNKERTLQLGLFMAWVEYERGNYEKAFHYYEEMYKVSSTQGNFNNLCIVPKYFESKSDWNNALKYYLKLNSIAPKEEVRSKLILCYEKLGRINDIINLQKPLAEKGDKESQYKLGQLYEKQKNKNLAIFWYKKAAEQKHLRAEEALAKYGIYINTQKSNSNSNSNNNNNNSNNNNHNHQQQQQVYTPEYGVRDVWVNCFDCHGTGQCSYCKGTGWCISTNGHGEYNSTYKCTICHGSGRCTYCYGSGGHYEKQQYQIR